jgi:hypothetical protein
MIFRSHARAARGKNKIRTVRNAFPHHLLEPFGVVGYQYGLDFRLPTILRAVLPYNLRNPRSRTIGINTGDSPVAESDNTYSQRTGQIASGLSSFQSAAVEHSAKNAFSRHYALPNLLENSATRPVALFSNLSDFQLHIAELKSVEYGRILGRKSSHRKILAECAGPHGNPRLRFKTFDALHAQ